MFKFMLKKGLLRLLEETPTEHINSPTIQYFNLSTQSTHSACGKMCLCLYNNPVFSDESDQEYDLFIPQKERRSQVVKTPRTDIERCFDMPLEIKIASARYGMCYGTSITAQRFQLLHPEYHFSKSSISAWMKRDLAKWIEEIPDHVAAVARDYEEQFPDDVPLSIVFKIKQNLIRERLAGVKIEKSKIPLIIRTTLQEMNREEDYKKYITPDFLDLMFTAGSKFVLGTLAHLVVKMKDF